MRHGSLFSGIGGFDLAAEWMGWENVFHCEWNPFGQRVLHHYWPNAKTFTDITKTDFTKYHGSIDIISGGFPCQPYSSAGKRKGKEDERHLWPEMCRAIREISPRFVVGENVRGLTNWNGGMVFDEVCAELESLGYQVAPVIIPACAVGAPHKRERIWFVAYCQSNRSTIGELGKSQTRQQIQTRDNINRPKSMGDATDSNGSTTRSSRTSGSIEGNRGNGHLFTQQRGESSELNNRLHEFLRNATNTAGIGLEYSNQAGDIRSKEITTRRKRSQSTNEFETNGSNATNATSFGFCGNGTAEQSQLETFGTRNGVGEENVANTNSNGFNQRNGNDEIKSSQARINAQRNANTGNVNGDATDTTSTRRREDNGQRKSGFNDQKSSPNNWDNFPTESPICGGNDGLPTELDGITFSKWRNESIKGYGNAIVPQVAYEIFKAIEKTI